MSNEPNQPGDADQLARVIDAAEKHYESSRVGIVVYWDEVSQRYRAGYQSLYDKDSKAQTIEVVRIPK